MKYVIDFLWNIPSKSIIEHIHMPLQHASLSHITIIYALFTIHTYIIANNQNTAYMNNLSACQYIRYLSIFILL